MKTSTAPKKFFNQKGQGMVEYALLFGFVAALAIFVFSGGFSNAIKNLFGTAGDNVESANNSFFTELSNDSGEDDESFDYETLDAEDISPTTYPPMMWSQLVNGIKGMYATVLQNEDANGALRSEVNLFNEISAMVDGHLATPHPSDGSFDWQNFMDTVESMQAQNNFTSSYKRGEETFTIQRQGNAVTATYSDSKGVLIYYKLSPDSHNVMKVETNSNKSLSSFMNTIGTAKGWEYNK